MAEEIKMPDTGREIAPREALLEAITMFDNGKVRAMFSEQALEALSMAIGQEATKEEVRRALVTQDGTTTSLLMTACSIGNYEAAEVLIQEGAPIDAVAPSGNTAVFYAARSGYFNILKLLSDKGADTNTKNVSGDTSLMFCASGASQPLEESSQSVDFVKCINHLLDLGASVETANKNGLNAIHCAASNFSALNAIFTWFSGKSSFSNALKTAVNQRTLIGDSPLHFAASEGAVKCCELLLSHGADPLVRSKGGKTPLACAKGSACISLLKSAEASASEAYHKVQQELLDELASESSSKSTNTTSNRKSKTSKKSNKPQSNSAPKAEPIPSPVVNPAISSSMVPSTPSSHNSLPVSPPSSTNETSAPSEPKAPASMSWASIASSSSSKAATPQKPAFTFKKSEETSQTAEQMAAEASNVAIQKSTPAAAVPLAEPSSPPQDLLDQHLSTLHPMTTVLGLNTGHLLGLSLGELSMEQLDALESIHQDLIKSINRAKLDVIRKQERAFFEEELDRRLETLKRVQSGKY